MTSQTDGYIVKRLAQGIAVMNILLLLLAIGLLIAAAGQLENVFENIGNAIFVIISVFVYSAIAVLIISRYPRHTVGWLFLIVGIFQVLTGLSFVLEYSQQIIASSDFASGLAASFRELVVVELAWLPAQFIPITLVLQFFPDGRLPSKRWWPLPVATLIAMVSWGITESSIAPGVIHLFELISPIIGFLAAFSLLGSLIAVVVRYRRSRGPESVQMKWLVYMAVTSILISLAFIVSGIESLIFDVFFLSLPMLLAITIGIAVLRYHLWDIDVIIRRTLQYALLTGFLALVYFGSVILLQSLMDLFVEEQSPLVIVLSTLAIAALFNPLRNRIQEFIDRRFFRQKYDAERMLAGFTRTARDEVDMDKLTSALLNMMEETLQPERASLWLKNIHDRMKASS